MALIMIATKDAYDLADHFESDIDKDGFYPAPEEDKEYPDSDLPQSSHCSRVKKVCSYQSISLVFNCFCWGRKVEESEEPRKR